MNSNSNSANQAPVMMITNQQQPANASSSFPLTTATVSSLSSLSFGGGSSQLASSEQAATLTEHIINLRREVSRLKANLEKAERDHKKNMAKMVREEKVVRDENLRLQKRLQMEVDRREALCRHLSESESSLEMDDERHFNETSRVRTVSSPVTAAGFFHNGNNQQQPQQSMATTNTTLLSTSLNSSGLMSSAAAAASSSIPISTGPVAVPPSLFTAPQASCIERCPACNHLIKFHPHGSTLMKPSAATVILPPSSLSNLPPSYPINSLLTTNSQSINQQQVKPAAAANLNSYTTPK
jgi:hypothetical protein